MESKIVTAVGTSVNTTLGPAANARLEKAMADAVLACNAEGISTEDKNAWIIRERKLAAYSRVLAEIEQENVDAER